MSYFYQMKATILAMLLLSVAFFFSYPDSIYSWRNSYLQHYSAVKKMIATYSYWDYS